MERLDIVGDSSPYFNVNKKEEKKSKKSKGKKVFSKELDNVHTGSEADKVREALGLSESEELDPERALDEIHDIGERLKGNPNLALVKEYRKAVGIFVRFVLKNSYTLEKQRLSGFKVLKLPQGQQPELTIIQIVDKKLDNLARQILQNQKDQLEILRRIDEIQGILIDLTT